LPQVWCHLHRCNTVPLPTSDSMPLWTDPRSRRFPTSSGLLALLQPDVALAREIAASNHRLCRATSRETQIYSRAGHTLIHRASYNSSIRRLLSDCSHDFCPIRLIGQHLHLPGMACMNHAGGPYSVFPATKWPPRLNIAYSVVAAHSPASFCLPYFPPRM
jgi:hypothetical protein